MEKKDKCPECQFEDGDHSQGCSKYEDKPLSIPEREEKRICKGCDQEGCIHDKPHDFTPQKDGGGGAGFREKIRK